MFFYSWYVILSNAKNLAKCLAKSQRGILRCAQDDIIAERKFSILDFQFENHSITSLDMRFSEKSAATAFFSAASGRNTILCPLIIEAGAKSSALIVSLV